MDSGQPESPRQRHSQQRMNYAAAGVILVVVTLLALAALPALLRPMVPVVHDSCLSNVKQIGLAFRMYASDNDGYLPPRSQWPAALLVPYLLGNTGLFICPSDERNLGPPQKAVEASYAMNQWAPTRLYSPEPGAAAEDLNLPLVFDATDILGGREVAAYRHSNKNRLGMTYEGLNVGFVSGKAKWMERREFERTDMSP